MSRNQTSAPRRKYAPTAPAKFAYRALMASRQKARYLALKLTSTVLHRWGHRLGIPGNVRAKIFWKAGRHDIVPLSQLYDYFLQPTPDGQFYADAPKWSSRSQTIINVLSTVVTKECSILEIGCNFGRNLNHLWQNGYNSLYGMEISENAVKRLRAQYPCLAGVPVETGPAELSVQKCRDHSIDVIFTMATLEHLHPNCKSLFKDIARTAKKYVLAIEPAYGKRSHNQYPWNIKNEFLAAGLICIESKPWSALWPGELTRENEWQDDMVYYEAFLFRVPNP